MTWNIDVIDPARKWIHGLRSTDRETLKQVSAALNVLGEMGPALGAPLVKPIKSSKFGHMRELRPGSAKNSEIRILFAFDPRQIAVVLVGGDKAGDWDRWYKVNVPLADSAYEAHLDRLK